jgi:hypothetical protein
MNRLIRLTSCLCIGAMLVFAALPGCNKGESAKATDNNKNKEPKHDHPDAGPHGGPLAEWGNEEYHAEFTVDPARNQVTVYILDDTTKAAPNIDAAKITKVKVTLVGSKPLISVDLKHDSKRSDAKGIAFVGTHEHFSKAAKMTWNISGNVGDKPYSNDVTYTTSKTTQLYLTPGGIYTAADIKANGNTTPAEKFKDKIWAHDDDLKPGDKFCPITKKKAEAACAWVINEQRYEFCCPPCLDKFMGWAHNQPEKVKDAREYVFK